MLPSGEVSSPPSDLPRKLPVPCVSPRRPPTWNIQASELCLATVNSIRKITNSPEALPDKSTSDQSRPAKALISLGPGDPTIFGHVAAPPEAAEAVVEAVRSGKFDGYAPSFGLPQAREAVAEFLSKLNGSALPVNPNNVYITSGCGHSVEICLKALANPGKNVLLPRPGFPVYDCWCADAGLAIRRYSLLPEKDWEVDLEEVRQLADEDTVALLICNPGNPCGNVFSEEHIKEVLGVAEDLKLPIISDEVYGGILFDSAKFFSTAAVAASLHSAANEGRARRGSVAVQRERGSTGQELASPLNGQVGEGQGHANGIGGGGGGTEVEEEESVRHLGCCVPVLTVSSISKACLVPGWRLGWIALHDPEDLLLISKFREALENQMQYTPLIATPIQAALPKILSALSPQYLRLLSSTVEESLKLNLQYVERIPGLDCPKSAQPKGGMFLMVRINPRVFRQLPSDIEWSRRLLREQSVVVIPGTAFEFPGWFRVLISAPAEVLKEAWSRIETFCGCHAQATL